MKNILFQVVQNQVGLQEFSEELNEVDWSAFPIGEAYGVWIPITAVLIVFFSFRFLAKMIENE
ncbi:MAG TPA: hypothetical protein DCR42_07535 [Flavobacteriaceae bacterium]|jgi:hypothetical protein|nr:hypothetical protein [Flavobacteriaceae bacterium]